MEFKVGQEVYLVPTQKRMGNPHFAKIEKIGRKWITLADNYGRFSPDSMMADGGQYSPPYRCYLSKEEYEVEAAADAAWNELNKLIDSHYSKPEWLDKDKIDKCIELLKKP